MNAYAFAHPFASHTFQHTNQCLQKRVQANARDSAGAGAKLDTTNLLTDRRAAYNKGLAKWWVTRKVRVGAVFKSLKKMEGSNLRNSF